MKSASEIAMDIVSAVGECDPCASDEERLECSVSQLFEIVVIALEEYDVERKTHQ